MATFYNCHIHTFTADAAPPRFLPFFLLPVVRSPVLGKMLSWALRRAIPGRSDVLERLAAFAAIGRLGSQEAVFQRVRGFYSDEFRFVVLTLDMDFMGAGHPRQPYLEQLDEACELRARSSDVVLPFVCADPRRPDVLDLVRSYIERPGGCVGIKLYPNLGYWPTDPDLEPVYAYAEENGIPVLTHCSRGGVHYRGRIVPPMRRHPNKEASLKGGRGDVFGWYSDPDLFGEVLSRHPDLRLCLAHYGGGEEWRRYLKYARPVSEKESWIRKISDLLEDPRYPNVYADISSVAADPENLPLISVLTERPETRDRVLYGSDYFMIQRDITERQFGLHVRATLGPDTWERIAVANPVRWLGAAAA